MSSFSFTAAQLDKTVELWRLLLDHPRIAAASLSESGTRTSLGNGRCGHPIPTDDEIRALVLNDGDRVDHIDRVDAEGCDAVLGPVEIILVSYSDYHGTDHDAANVRALATMPGVTVVWNGLPDGGVRAQVRLGAMTEFANAHGEEPDVDSADDAIMWLARLVNTMNVTINEAVIDDSAHVEYLIELADAAWDEWIRLDLPGELRQLARDLRIRVPESTPALSVSGQDVQGGLDEYVTDLFSARSEQFRRAYYDYDGNEWVAENATSIINARHKQAVRYAASTVFGWPPPTVHSSWAA